MGKEKFRKEVRKPGIKYFRCQHLKEGTQKLESGSWWLGDKLRVIVCPLCDRMHAGNMLNFLYSMYHEVNEYQKNNKESKEEL